MSQWVESGNTGTPEYATGWGVQRMSSYLELEQRLEKAVQFIAQAALRNEQHRGLFLLHSIRVGFYLQAHGYAEDIVLAGFLHDVVEDTPVSLDEVQTTFGEPVARLVAANTHNMEFPRLERDHEALERCLQIGKDAMLVMAADKLDNLQVYLPFANPDMMDWLKSFLSHFLASTQPIIGDQAVWQALREQYEGLSGK